jgi:protoporphyrinogen oxidase
VIIGAGPAGLTAAYRLAQRGVKPIVLEADDQVGGISRTVERDGWRFDIGGHRFFTKVADVEAFWHEILPDDDFLLRPRKSRIYYDGKFIDYPLRAGNALRSMGIVEAVTSVLSYVWARIHPPKDQSNYEGWMVGRFGWRLYRKFFKSYTEKLWGVDATEIQADWAAQRVKNLSLGKAVIGALLPKRNQKDVTSLIEEFQYPKYGPGMMWEVCRDKVVAGGGDIRMNTKVTRIHHRDGRAYQVDAVGPDGEEVSFPCADVISSMPFSTLVEVMDPSADEAALAAAKGFRYRDFLAISLVVPADKVPWDDNWIYIHAPEIKTMRIQNFGSWSPYMVKDGTNVLGLEYTVLEGDESWNASDDVLVERGKQELEWLGLVAANDVERGYVVRMPKAYPLYDEDYQAHVDTLRGWLATHAANVHPTGRNGMFRYNNQDHSMYTAMLTVENIVDGTHHDVWEVNVEEEYHEEAASSDASSTSQRPPGSHGTGRDAPVLPRR